MPSSSLWKYHFKHCQMSPLPTLSSLNSGLLILRCIGPMVTYSILWKLMFSSMIKAWAEAMVKKAVLGDHLQITYHKVMICDLWNASLVSTFLVLVSLWSFNYKETNYFLCSLLAPESKKVISMFFKTLRHALAMWYPFPALSPCRVQSLPCWDWTSSWVWVQVVEHPTRQHEDVVL